MGIGKHFGALAVTALVMTAAAAPTPQSPTVKLAGNTTVLAMCGTTCPRWNDADIDVIIDQFIAPTHPPGVGDTITKVAVTAPGEAWPLTGILRLLGLAVGDPRIFGPGGGAWPAEPWWKLTGLFDLTSRQSIRAGVTDLELAMADVPTGDRQIIYGLSLDAAVANAEKKKLAAQYPKDIPAPDIDFVLQGDLNLPNGGLLARFPGLYIPLLDWVFDGPAPTDTQFETVEINRQYDGFADFPLYPLNVVSLLNAVLGVVYLHTWPFDVSLPADDPTKSPAYQGIHGDTSYYFFESQNLPLFAPLRTFGVPEALIDVVEPFFRVLVELGYDRSIPAWEPTPARLIPRLDPAKVLIDLINAVGEGINNAAAIVGIPPLVRTRAPAVAPEVQTQRTMPTAATITTTITETKKSEPFELTNSKRDSDTPDASVIDTPGSSALDSSADPTRDPSSTPDPEPESREAFEDELEASDRSGNDDSHQLSNGTTDDNATAGSGAGGNQDFGDTGETGDTEQGGDTEESGDTEAGSTGTDGQPNDA